MIQGQGVVGLLYAARDLIESGVMFILSAGAVILFFLIVVNYISKKTGRKISFLPDFSPAQLSWALFILFIIFAIYSLIGLTASIFGVNSSPSGGMLVH
jgi:hypothetical protein